MVSNPTPRCAAAEELFTAKPNFRSVSGTAEATTLPDDSIDFVIAGQAFHWFDPARTRAEFARILRPGGKIALVWNQRRLDEAFAREYQSLVHRFAVDHQAVRGCSIQAASDTVLREFFGTAGYVTAHFDNEHRTNFDQLRAGAFKLVHAASRPSTV